MQSSLAHAIILSLVISCNLPSSSLSKSTASDFCLRSNQFPLSLFLFLVLFLLVSCLFLLTSHYHFLFLKAVLMMLCARIVSSLFHCPYSPWGYGDQTSYIPNLQNSHWPVMPYVFPKFKIIHQPSTLK